MGMSVKCPPQKLGTRNVGKDSKWQNYWSIETHRTPRHLHTSWREGEEGQEVWKMGKGEANWTRGLGEGDSGCQNSLTPQNSRLLTTCR